MAIFHNRLAKTYWRNSTEDNNSTSLTNGDTVASEATTAAETEALQKTVLASEVAITAGSATATETTEVLPLTNQNNASATEISAVIGTNTAAASAATLQAGITLDIARHYYSVEVIKQYIDTISQNGGGFLQLHISDNENYGFESTLLGQTVGQAVLNSDGSYTNPQTQQKFLSNAQISEIVNYAKAAGVEIIPDVDSPSHIGGIVRLLQNSQGKAFVESIISDVVSDEIDITSETAIGFMQKLYAEVIAQMNGSAKHFHIGGDEFGYSAANNFEFINYVNTMAAYLEGYDLTTRIWNDGLIKSNLADLNHNVEITYWSHSGNPTTANGNHDSATASAREAMRASMQDLLEEGFDVLNYDAHYLYYNPEASALDSLQERNAWEAKMIQDIRSSWDIGVIHDYTAANGAGADTVADDSNTAGKIIGASFVIWGEKADGVSDATIYASTDSVFTALASKMYMQAVDFTRLDDITFSLSEETVLNWENEVWTTEDSLAELIRLDVPNEVLFGDHHEYAWLNGEYGDVLQLDAQWQAIENWTTAQGDTHYIGYQNGNVELYVDTDISVLTI